jgi:hypothetical protein
MRNLRRKIWIDRFQTLLSVRLALYFVLYQLAVWSLFWTASQVGKIGEPLGNLASAVAPIATIGLGLLFILDALKETHRIVGPLYRFRKTVQAVTAGEDVVLVRLRTGDHLQELKTDFNAMLRELEKRGAITLVQPAGSAVPQPVAVEA